MIATTPRQPGQHRLPGGPESSQTKPKNAPAPECSGFAGRAGGGVFYFAGVNPQAPESGRHD